VPFQLEADRDAGSEFFRCSIGRSYTGGVHAAAPLTCSFAATQPR
jgi:hypothetical protein